MSRSFAKLASEIRACTSCEVHLENGVRPVFQAQPESKILIAGQAPGRKVHETGVPFDDPSGDRLREWLGVTREQFYDDRLFAILPMGFCYPGTGKSGDLPPRPECADLWRNRILDQLKDIELTLVIGKYAHDWHLKNPAKTLTENVRNWRDYTPDIIPLPHPSPRNNIWLKKNPWFAEELIPQLQARVSRLTK